MADQYDALGRSLGIPPAMLPTWRKMAGAPAPAPPAPPPVPSYEGATLQSMMPSAPAPMGPPPPPVPAPSYEGATLQGMAPTPPGVTLAEPPRGASVKPRMRLATADNVQSAPAAVSPGVMAQINRVADNSDAASKSVKAGVDADERKKNLEGATFFDGAGAPGVASAGAQVVIPGGRRTSAWQVQEGLDLGPEAKEAVASADQHARTAADLDYMAGQTAAEYERGYLERHNDASAKYAAEESARAQKYTEQTDAAMGRLDELRAQIREAKVDPMAGMNSGFAKVASTVAIALGAFASKHGENHGLEAVKHQISQNILRQEKEIDRLERGAKGEMNFLASLKQQYGDIRVAKEAAHIAYLEAAKTELAKNLGDPSVADPRLLAGYERIRGKIDDELVQRTGHFQSLVQDRVIRHDVNAQPRILGGMTPEAKHDARYLAESYEKAGIPAALAQLKDVDRVIDTFGDGDIPGVGPVMGKIPTMFLSDRAVDGRQAVQSIKNAIGHAIFGGALSPTEGEKLNNQLDGANDAASLRRTVQSFRQTLQHRAANIAAGASPEGNMLYNLRGGSVQQIPLNKPATPHIREAK